MGIDAALAIQLIKCRDSFVGCKAGLMLGRQRLSIKPRFARRVNMALKNVGNARSLDSLRQPDGYAETFLSEIGMPQMQSMDISDFEGCDLVHDLNEPVPEDFRGKFDVVVDGGTIEHVFNVPQALDNAFDLLGEGGVFISINGMTGWAGHGFYQFSPELVWRYWQDTRNCEVLQCCALPTDPRVPLRDAPDTGVDGARFRGRGMSGRWYLFYIVQRTPAAVGNGSVKAPAQGDYAVRWKTESEVP